VDGRLVDAFVQLVDDADDVLQVRLHAGPVPVEDAAGDVRIAGGDDLPHLGERQVERSQPADDPGIDELGCVIGAVARAGVDPRRRQDPGVVVSPQRLHRQQARP
jgi:hypothetical protein